MDSISPNSMKIEWPDLILPPINLWNYPNDTFLRSIKRSNTFLTYSINTNSGMVMKIQLINDNCKPVQGSKSSAGWDVKASWVKKTYVRSPVDITLDYIEWEIGLGFKTAIPEGWAAILMPRSGLGSKGFKLTNTIGLIDPDYRGEWIIKATSPSSIEINQEDRIGQFILVQTYPSQNIEFVTTLDNTTRGSNGFGSTGV